MAIDITEGVLNLSITGDLIEVGDPREAAVNTVVVVASQFNFPGLKEALPLGFVQFWVCIE
jgi:hypothetical protein